MRRRRKHMSDINVVPYIDVCLVLLIIFMATAPLITQGVKVNLPHASAQTMPTPQTLPLVVTVNQQGKYYINIADNPRRSVNAATLQRTVQTALHRNPARKVYVRGDQGAIYGNVVKAMVLLQQSGATTVGLITDDNKQT